MKESFDRTLKPSKYKKLLPYLALVVLLALSVLVWQFYENYTVQRAERRYSDSVNSIVNEITGRLHQYEMILLGGAGVFAASEGVTRAEWQAYYEYQQVNTLYPGIQAVAYSRVVWPPELAPHIEEIRAEGFPDYTVWPEGERDLYAPVVFVEPFDARNQRAFGYDMFTEPVRRAAMERAWDTGTAAITGMVTLVTETDEDLQPGFLMYIPIYSQGMPLNTTEERRAATEGYVFAALRIHDLMQGIFPDPLPNICFEIYDGAEASPEALIYDSHIYPDGPDEEHKPLFTSRNTLDLYGHQWTLAFHSMSVFETTVDRFTPGGILAASLLLSILIFFYLRALETTGSRALSLAREMTAALRKNEKLLRAERDRSQGYLNTTDTIMVSLDASGNILMLNRFGLEFLGYKEEQIIGKNWFSTVLPQPESMEQVYPVFQRIMRGELEAVRTFENEVITSAGKRYMIAWSNNYLSDDKGQIIGTLGSGLDITERKKDEDALLESEQRYRLLIENGTDVIWTIDLEGRLTYISPAIENLIGFTSEEAMTISMNEYIVQEDSDALMARLAEELVKLPAERSPYVIMPVRFKTKDNRLVHAEISAAWLLNEQGNTIGIQGSTRDITERKQLEEQIIESKQMYQSVVDTQQETVTRYLADTTLTFVNDAYCRFYGKPRRELLGHKFLEFHPPEIQDQIIELINNLTPNKPSVTHEHYILFPDGSIRWLEWTEQALFNEAGEIKEFQAVGRDITERKKQETELQYISFHDQLTGLYNRHYFENELQRLAGAREHPVAIISADLDGLKLVNDTRGHSEGDSYLQAGAEMLKRALRTSDILARVGGDEFALILPRTTQKAGAELVARIHRQIEEYNRGQAGLPLSISIGLAVSEHSEESLEEAYNKADAAMYTDKLQRGKKARAEIITSLLASLYKRGDLGEGAREQVQELSSQLGQALNLDERRMADLGLLAQVYDLGKINMPDHIVHSSLLQKSGELTEAEDKAIHRHPETGYRIASSSPELAGVADLILKHHENFDGSGYPLGLKGEDIPVECRILAIATAYSAMVNPRAYAKTFEKAKAIKELQRCAGTQFDPELVEKFSLIAEKL